MVDRLEQRGFEPVANVEHAVAAIGKSAWPVGADVGEWRHEVGGAVAADAPIDRSEEHTSELQSLMRISYAVFCLNKTKCDQNRNGQSLQRRARDNTIR